MKPGRRARQQKKSAPRERFTAKNKNLETNCARFKNFWQRTHAARAMQQQHSTASSA